MRHDGDDPVVSQLSDKVAQLGHQGAAVPERNNTIRQPQRGDDITEIFSRASEGLHLGQLVKDEAFTLFESVTALEIMDPKMDSGFSLPEQDSVLETFDPLDHATPEETLWIMDELFCAEMVWHDGYPLSQTLFSSLHMHNLIPCDPLPLERLVFQSHRSGAAPPNAALVTHVLRAYCLAVAKCCDHIINEVVSEHFYEEEDFITATYTRNLLTNIPDEAIMALLDTAVATIEHLKLPDPQAAALMSRLRMRRLMLQAYSPSQGIVDVGKPALFKGLQEHLPSLLDTHKLGKPTSMPVFSERTQRFLASNTPPRPLKQITWDVATVKFSQLCSDTIAAFEVAQVGPQFQSYALMRFSWEFTSRKPQPLTYPRAMMQGLLFKANAILGQKPHMDVFLADLEATVLPASDILDPYNWTIEIPTSPRFIIARKVDDFVRRSMEEFLHLYRMCLQNRCRIRRNFAQSIGILDQLQAMAEEYDSDIISECWASAMTRDPISFDRNSFFPLAAWVYHHKLQVMQIVILMGFELEIYLANELASSYALLSLFTRSHVEHYNTIIGVLEGRLASRPSARARTQISSSIAYLTIRRTHAKVRFALAAALADLFSLLQLLGLLPAASTNELQSELRMRPFLPIGTPTLPSAQDLAALTTDVPPGTKLSVIRESADAHLRRARTELATLRTADAATGRFQGVEAGWQAEVKALTHVAVGAAVTLATMDGIWTKASAATVADLTDATKKQIQSSWKVDIPAPEARVDAWWIVPRLTQRS